MFQNLFIDSGASYTLQSNVKTYNYWKNGTVTLGGYTMTVNNDQASAFTSSPSSSTYTGVQYSYTAVTTDREAETRSYSISTNWSGVTIDSSSGVCTFPAPPYKHGYYSLDITASDGNHTTHQTFTVTIIWAVTITTTPQTIAYNNQYYFYYFASNTTATWSLSSNASWVAINPSIYFLYGISPVLSSTHYYWLNLTATATSSHGYYWSNWTVTITVSLPSPPLAHQNVSFTSSPLTEATVNKSYAYHPTVNNPGNYTLWWSILTNATGLSVDEATGRIGGILNLSGSYFIHLMLFDGTDMTWQNYTLVVDPSSTGAIVNLVLALVFGFGLIVISIIDPKRKIWPVFAGFIWIVLSVVVFYSLGTTLPLKVMWMTIGLGIGLILMLEGATAYAAGREKT